MGFGYLFFQEFDFDLAAKCFNMTFDFRFSTMSLNDPELLYVINNMACCFYGEGLIEVSFKLLRLAELKMKEMFEYNDEYNILIKQNIDRVLSGNFKLKVKKQDN